VKWSKSRVLSDVMTPTAEIQVRQIFSHRSTGPSLCHSNRIGKTLFECVTVTRSTAKAGTKLDPNAKRAMRDRITLSSDF
jgi:hypothetical protein